MAFPPACPIAVYCESLKSTSPEKFDLYIDIARVPSESPPEMLDTSYFDPIENTSPAKFEELIYMAWAIAVADSLWASNVAVILEKSALPLNVAPKRLKTCA